MFLWSHPHNASHWNNWGEQQYEGENSQLWSGRGRNTYVSLPAKETYIVTGVTIYFQLCGQSP